MAGEHLRSMKEISNDFPQKELLEHPLWNFKIPSLEIPDQPHFQAYLDKKRRVRPTTPLLPSPNGTTKNMKTLLTLADIKNLSLIASRNLEKERENSTYLLSQSKKLGSFILIGFFRTKLRKRHRRRYCAE
jgi:hypothetical protein